MKYAGDYGQNKTKLVKEKQVAAIADNLFFACNRLILFSASSYSAGGNRKGYLLLSSSGPGFNEFIVINGYTLWLLVSKFCFWRTWKGEPD